MIEIAKGDYTILEVEEKYQHLYHEYKAHLELHKLKTNIGTFKGLLVTTAEIIGDITKLNLGKALKTGFEIFDSQSRLLEIEQNAPGKEVGYVYDINKNFSKV